MAKIDGDKTPAKTITDHLKEALARLGLGDVNKLVNQGKRCRRRRHPRACGKRRRPVSESLLNGEILVPLEAVDAAAPLRLRNLMSMNTVQQVMAERTGKVADLRRALLAEAASPGERTVGQQFDTWAGLQFASTKSAPARK